ncbi:hypothetical protein EZ880_24325 (plasmid) [Salmonella enterica subsp. enterica serovar 4,12:i:-]|uniref:hypothetical protein n=1 Tax=Salmonella enterica TaxID=28901 RepID=UPI0027D20889|nr:hypothetical protein [Salmonella enterica]WMC28624.1 hypothetical protein EZ880_24325 [Salmonella enterica subsp. enterica serovar 4,12:i:-]
MLNSMIQDALAKPGEQQVTVPVLTTANIRDGELRRLSTWEAHPGALALVDNVYHRIAGISKEDGLITLEDKAVTPALFPPGSRRGRHTIQSGNYPGGPVTGCVSQE